MNLNKYDRYPYEIDIIRTSRKTVQIRIVAKNHVELRIPSRLSDRRIQMILDSKDTWIQKHLENFQERDKIVNLSEGTCWPCFGQDYQLKFKASNESRYVAKFLEMDLLVIYKKYDESRIFEAIKLAYIERLKPYIAGRIESLSKVMDVEAIGFRIKSQKTLWGSCSSRRHLNFNWKIGFAPVEVIDYLIIHEMCHLKHMNHGKAFWAMVEQFDPAYKVHKRWLKDNSGYLRIYT